MHRPNHPLNDDPIGIALSATAELRNGLTLQDELQVLAMTPSVPRARMLTLPEPFTWMKLRTVRFIGCDEEQWVPVQANAGRIS